MGLLGRALRVDHVDGYKAPKQFDENELDEDGDPKLLKYEATGAEGKGLGVHNVIDSQKKNYDLLHQNAERRAKQTIMEDEDEAWAKAFEDVLKKKAEAKEAKKQE